MKEKLKIKSLAIILILIFIFQYVSMIMPLLESIAETYVANEIEWKISKYGTSVIISPNNVNSISNLETIIIPSQVGDYDVIGISGFGNCKNLKKVIIEDRTSNFYFQSNVFNGCENLEEVNFPESSANIQIREKAFYNCSKLNISRLAENVTYIDKNAFYGCSAITELQIQTSSISQIPDYCFSGCNNLANITIPESVTSIGYSAFQNCSKLTSISIPENVTSIGNYAFQGCSMLTNVYIPKNVTNIGTDAFHFCNALENINVSEDNSMYCSIDGILFSKNKKGIYKCPENKNLNEYAIPDTVSEILSNAFYGCEDLSYLTIPNNVKTIGWAAFYNCYNLQSVTFEEGENEINISQYAFYRYSADHYKYARVNFPKNLKYTIGNYNFNIGYTIICAENSTADKYAKANNIPYIYPDKKTAVDNGNTYEFYVKNGNEAVDIELKNEISQTKFLVPSKLIINAKEYNIKSLNNMFRNNTGINIKEIEIPNTIVEISNSALIGCTNLEKIVIPESIKNIGNNIFPENTNVTIYCVKGSEAHTYAIENNIKYVLKVKIEFNDQNLYNKIKDLYLTKILEFDDHEKKIYIYQTDIDEITNLDLSGLEIADLKGIEQFSKLEILNASNNNISSFENNVIKIETLKELNLSGNNFENANISYELENLPNLEKLNLSNTNISDLSNIEAIKNLANLKSLNLDNNRIKDITIINETIDKFTENLSIKNQNIEDYIIKKNITMDEIANIIKYSQQNEYLNGQLTFEYCNRTEDTIEFDDDIDDENKVAKIKINGGIMDGTDYMLKPSSKLIATTEVKDDVLEIHIYNSETNEECYDANIFYSIDDESNSIKYTGKFYIKEGDHIYHVKLFNKEIDIKINNTLQKGFNTIYEYNINALKNNGKIYVYANTNNVKKYSFNEDGEYTEYTGPIDDTGIKQIYVKIGDGVIKLVQIENVTDQAEDEYSLYNFGRYI